MLASPCSPLSIQAPFSPASPWAKPGWPQVWDLLCCWDWTQKQFAEVFLQSPAPLASSRCTDLLLLFSHLSLPVPRPFQPKLSWGYSSASLASSCPHLMVSIATAPIHFHGNCILIPSPAGCLVPGSANKGKEGERPPIQSSNPGGLVPLPWAVYHESIQNVLPRFSPS